MSTMDKQTNMTVEEAVLEHGCYNCGHVRLDKSCKVYCQLRAEGGICLAYNSWTPLPEPCEDAVSREEAVKVLRADPSFVCAGDKAQAITDILSLPSVTPQPKTAHWIHFASSDDCSGCGWSTGKYISPSDYCPKCGARMVEQQESEEA